MTPSPDVDRRLMRLAIAMAARGLGTTAPNPAVGAVIARDTTGPHFELIARGWTQPGGRPHAETEAIARAGAAAKGATLYVSLEPCSHHGRTPPCCEAVIAAGLARVVVGIEDPDPRVRGRGLAALRADGIEVVTGVEAEEATWVTAGHILRQGGPGPVPPRPFVQLKLALSADHRLAAGTGRPVWITGPEARAEGHRLRAEADAILVGAGTLRADDPELTCRLPGLADQSPHRIVLDSRAEMSPASMLARTARTIPVTAVIASGLTANAAAAARLAALEAAGVHLLEAPVDAAIGRFDLSALLARLARHLGITRLLVEGGPTLARAVLAEGLADEVALFRSPKALAAGGHPFHPDGAPFDLDRDPHWHATGSRRLGADTVTRYRNRLTETRLARRLKEL